MNKLERCLAALEGREPDRVPTFSLIFDAKPVDDALGMWHVPVWRIIRSPFMQKLVDRTTWLYNFITQPHIGGVAFFVNVLRADVRMGFDCGLAEYWSLTLLDHAHMRDTAGRYYDMCDDGFGGIYAMYREGLLKDPAAWKSFDKPDIATYARRARYYLSLIHI